MPKVSSNYCSQQAEKESNCLFNSKLLENLICSTFCFKRKLFHCTTHIYLKRKRCCNTIFTENLIKLWKVVLLLRCCDFWNFSIFPPLLSELKKAAKKMRNGPVLKASKSQLLLLLHVLVSVVWSNLRCTVKTYFFVSLFMSRLSIVFNLD